MFHVRDDFRAGEPISAVPASWFNKVGSFINNLVGGYGVTVRKNESGPSVIELDMGLQPTAPGGTPEDKTDNPAELDQNGDSWTWSAGGTDGLKLDAYCKIAPQSSGSNNTVFQRCRLTVSKDGRIIKADGLPGRVRIQAKNA